MTTPRAIKLSRAEAAQLIATLAGQLAHRSILNQYLGATSVGYLEDTDERVVIYLDTEEKP